MKLKNIIIIILIVVWGIVIFYASSRTSNESNGKSRELIYKGCQKVISITNKLKITNVNLNDKKYFNNLVNKLNKPLRKCAHATVYFILSILIMIGLRSFNVEIRKAIIITIVSCFLYSLTDEFHQLFVDGRSSLFSDCLIDTLGATLGVFLTKIFLLIVEK